MRRQCLVILLFLFLGSQVFAREPVRFFWSFGDAGVFFDATTPRIEPRAQASVGNLNWITSFGLGWRFTLFSIDWGRDWAQTLLLPVEINLSPFGDTDGLYLTLYGRGGLMTRFDNGPERSFIDRSTFFGAGGLRIAWAPSLGSSWSSYTAAYVEYTTNHELRVGFSVDASIIAVGFGWLTLFSWNDYYYYN